MPLLDWLFLAGLLVSLLMGAWRGLFYEVMSLLGWFAAYWTARVWASQAADFLPMQGASESLSYAAGFVLVFIAVALLAGLLAVLVKKLFSAVGLRPVDRVRGAVFGLLRGMLLMLLVVAVVGMTPLAQSTSWQASLGVDAGQFVLKALKPVLPPQLSVYWPD